VQFDRVGDYLTDTKWYESIIVLCGLEADAGAIVSGLIDRDVLLAAVCFSQLHGENGTLKRLLIEKLVSVFEHERSAYIPGARFLLTPFVIQRYVGLYDYGEHWRVGVRLVRYWEWIRELADPGISKDTFQLILSYALDREDDILRHYAANALARIDVKTSMEYFVFLLYETDAELELKENAALALAALRTPEAIEVLVDEARDISQSTEIRKSAVLALGESYPEYHELAIATLETLIEDLDPEVAQAARNALAAIRRRLGLEKETEGAQAAEDSEEE
jgi:hypothetical protein